METNKTESLTSILIQDPNQRKAISASLPCGPYLLICQHDIGKIDFNLKWDDLIKSLNINELVFTICKDFPSWFYGNIVIANNCGHPAICAYHYDTSD